MTLSYNAAGEDPLTTATRVELLDSNGREAKAADSQD